MMGALDAVTGDLLVHTSRTKRSADYVELLERIDAAYGPRPGRISQHVVLVQDNGPVHTSKLSRQALAARPWLLVECLPKYAPELNDIERSWRDLKRHYLAHRTFLDVEDLESSINAAVADLNLERNRHPCDNLRIAA